MGERKWGVKKNGIKNECREKVKEKLLMMKRLYEKKRMKVDNWESKR